MIQPKAPTVLLTPEDAAQRLCVSLSTLAKWRLTGSGPYYIKLGGRIRYTVDDIEEFITLARRASTSSKGEAA